MKRILLLTNNKRASGKAVYNALRTHIPNATLAVIKESAGNKRTLLERRIRRHGYLKVANQLVFQIVIAKLMRFLYRNRLRALSCGLDYTPIPSALTHKVATINDPEVLDIIADFKPDLIVVSGTRIIKKKVLEQLPCEIINLHAGITPEYRGVHGMYWALRNGQPELAGVTLHRVDAGIDTGAIVSQARCVANKEDCFVTYPLLQLKKGTDLLIAYIKQDGSGGEVLSQGQKGPLYYHPTATGYLYHAMFGG